MHIVTPPNQLRSKPTKAMFSTTTGHLSFFSLNFIYFINNSNNYQLATNLKSFNSSVCCSNHWAQTADHFNIFSWTRRYRDTNKLRKFRQFIVCCNKEIGFKKCFPPCFRLFWWIMIARWKRREYFDVRVQKNNAFGWMAGLRTDDSLIDNRLNEQSIERFVAWTNGGSSR